MEFLDYALCAWIRQPANTWSNLVFLGIGILILSRTKSGPSRHFSGLGWVSVLTGIGSAFYPASESRMGAIADYLGMYLGSAYMLTTNIHRLTHWKSPVRIAVYWSILALTLGTMILNENLARAVYAMVTIVCCLSLEAVIYIRNRRTEQPINYTWFGIVGVLFILSYGIWKLDEARWVCNPQNHWINGHAIWHVLNAVSFYALFLYYKQFNLSHET